MFNFSNGHILHIPDHRRLIALVDFKLKAIAGFKLAPKARTDSPPGRYEPTRFAPVEAPNRVGQSRPNSMRVFIAAIVDRSFRFGGNPGLTIDFPQADCVVLI
jgi:hypothetical protein